MNLEIINQLYSLIEERKSLLPSESYVAKMFDKGRCKIAQKVGEEAVEVAISAARKKKDEVIYESADLLFHLLMLWIKMDITPDEVMEELKSRDKYSKLKNP